MGKKHKMLMKKTVAVCILTGLFLGGHTTVRAEEDIYAEQISQEVWEEVIPEIEGLSYQSSMELDYAQRFDLHYYNDGYAVIDIYGSEKYLVVPEDMPVPEHLEENMKVLQKPLNQIYLTATSAMALFDELDALDCIRLSGTNTNGWYIDRAVEAMENGEMIFAGKYNEPDYELLIDEECNLSIQSTMILHSPKVKEMLEDLGIPVFVEYSTYEPHPLGKPEWSRLYGFLTGKEEAADAFMEKQKKIIAGLENFTNTEKTVAYFYVNTNGQAVVREISDYIPAIIELAGGRYIFSEQVSMENSSSTATITMEEFYEAAVNADYLVYNASIDGPVSTLEELYAKSGLFADFKAVREGNVWCTGKQMFQASNMVAEFVMDFNRMLTGSEGNDMIFFHKVQ